MTFIGSSPTRNEHAASTPVQGFEGAASGVGLSGIVSHGPLSRRPIDGEGGPPASVFVAEVDQQRVSAVLDAQAMPRICFFMQGSDCPVAIARLSDKRSPPLATGRASRFDSGC
jgi:hypothetical protein